MYLILLNLLTLTVSSSIVEYPMEILLLRIWAMSPIPTFLTSQADSLSLRFFWTLFFLTGLSWYVLFLIASNVSLFSFIGLLAELW